MKDCRFCDKAGLLILPLRYAAVVGDDAARLLPDLPGELGQGVKDLALTHGRYAPRLLRGGYVYTLIQRSGVKYWEAYVATEDAFLYKFRPESPPTAPVEFSCDRSACGIDASCISVDQVQTVQKMYLLFSPEPLTPTKLNEYKAESDAYVAADKLQAFDPKAWAKAGQRNQPHSMKPEELEKHVPEWLLYGQGKDAYDSPLGKLLLAQAYAALSDAYAGMPATAPEQPASGRLGTLVHKLKRTHAAAFVIHDHIGITQELNDFRNSALEGLEHYLAAQDTYGASNLQRMQIYESIQEVKQGMLAGVVRSTETAVDAHGEQSDAWFDRRRTFAARLRASGDVDQAEKIEEDIEHSLENRARNYEKALAEARASAAGDWKSKYERRFDVAEMERFNTTLHAHLRRAYEKVDARAIQHLRWFESDRLVNAFDVFDSKRTSDGYSFALHTALCTFGISGCAPAEAALDEWIKGSPSDRKNLYLRGLFFNQQELMAAAKQAADEMRAAAGKVELASAIPPALAIKATKGLVDGFKKLDSAFDEWVRNQSQPFSQKWAEGKEIVLFHKTSELTRTVFRSGLGGAFDKHLVAVISGWLYAKLRAVSGSLAFDELMLSLPREKVEAHRRARAAHRAEQRRTGKAQVGAAKVASQVEGSLEQLISDAQQKAKSSPALDKLKGSAKPPTNNYHQTRIGVVLGCIEMIALGEKLAHFENTEKGWLEVGGSVMAVGSVVLDTYYSAAKSIREIEPYKGVNAISKGADIVRGGFKLGAGVLGFGAGLCGALLDWNKMDQAKSRTLVAIYGLRSLNGFVSAGITLVAAFSYTESLLRHLAKGYAKHSIRYRALIFGAEQAIKVAARVRLLVWAARLNWIGLALTAVEIGHLRFRDDDLQNWCEKSVFRAEKTHTNWLGRKVESDRFDGVARELEALEHAAQTVGVGAWK